MPRVFAYCRVSTAEQATANQVLEIKKAGFDIHPKRVIEETISGSTPAADRPLFSKLLDKLDDDAELVVTKLDRLGRDTADVLETIKRIAAIGAKLHCLALEGVDLASSAGKLHLTILAAVAQFERDVLRERTYAGLARARAEGRVGGRKDVLEGIAKKRRVTLDELRAEIRAKIAAGGTSRGLAKEYGVSHTTISKASR
ncbi:recombinase family protein [Paraburkholderia rhynchosiae]|uniref:Resolvase n=1 Tax=Paraburkholderia rhynchosiae TaxID=487049 RepID=A0A2N7WD06_9BURK|nr:recombinase family protein [Paraburkholderia rhynchosiae]PMS27309.1 resolvase [Paraburkholderia rhynchosiae]CAB3744294.1 Tn3 family transposase ISYps3 [Paraburkholderia rhynchosiae]